MSASTDPLVEPVAQAICAAFWENCIKPETWAAQGKAEREVWRNCARKAISTARELKIPKDAA